jgi:TatD DNase family protein
MASPSWIDTHTHIEMLENSPEQVIIASEAANVNRMITIGTRPDENKKVYQIAKDFFPKVSCTLGIHPHEAKFYNDEVENDIQSKLNDECVVGVGEIGLDYFYNHSKKKAQIDVFERQMDLAKKYRMPIQIHTREAENDTAEMVHKYKGKVKGLFHCFTSSLELAKKGLDCGYNISFSGIVTFKKADDLREVAKYVPLDRIHIETDAPFLAPVPHRGKKNSPEFLVHTAEFMAELKQVSLEELSESLMNNAKTLFPKLVM